MSFSEDEINSLVERLRRLTPTQKDWINSAIHAFGAARQFAIAPDSDVITDAALASLGDRLLSHHAGSRQALSKDGGFKPEVQHLLPSKVRRCHHLVRPRPINNFSLKSASPLPV